MIQLMQGDCLERMKEIPDGSVDMVLTDPPYGTTACKWDTVIDLPSMWVELKRIIKPSGAIVMTAGQPFSSALVMSNPAWFAYEWVWVKTKITGVLNAKRMPVRKHEQVLVFCDRKSTGTYNAQGVIPCDIVREDKVSHSSDNYGKRGGVKYKQSFTNWPRDVLEIKSEGNTVHPTQKPVALMEYLIKTYTNEDEKVLDFTMGSGTTGVACVNTGRHFIGIELGPDYYAIAERRISEAQLAVAI